MAPSRPLFGILGIGRANEKVWSGKFRSAGGRIFATSVGVVALFQ
jgi:hypothetical protein